MDWEARNAALWAEIDDLDEAGFRRRMDELVAELPENDPVGFFERAAAFDSTGHSDQAVPLYEQALAGGLEDPRRRRAVIQMASSLRNLGRAEESVELLSAEHERDVDVLGDEVNAFLALSLVDAGREREGAVVALLALSKHVTRYERSIVNYSLALLGMEEQS